MARGYEVHAVARAVPADMAPAGGLRWHAADLLDPTAARALVRSVAPTHWLHLGWYAEHGKFWTARENLPWVACSLAMLEAFADAGGRRVVMAGTCAEYDWRTADVCLAGVTAERPTTLYGAAKHALCTIALAFCASAGISAAWGRIFFPYGPGERGERLVPGIVRNLLRGEPALCSEGTQQRDFLHVVDVAAAFAALVENDFRGAIDIGSGEPVAVRDVALRLGDIVGRPDLIRLGARPAQAGEPPLLVANNAALTLLGWRPRFDLQAGLLDTVAWWRAQ